MPGSSRRADAMISSSNTWGAFRGYDQVKSRRPVNFTDSKTQPFHESSPSPWKNQLKQRTWDAVRVERTWLGMHGLRFRVWGSGFGFRVWGLGFRIQRLLLGVHGLGFRVWG